MQILAEGSIFAGRYRITGCIAQGGMGSVYEAVHAEMGRRCALKVMLPDILQSAEMRDRFRQEARVTAQIESEFIVDVLDAGVDEATAMPFLVMELLRGEALDKRLKRIGPFAHQDVVMYLRQAAVALDKAHRAFIVHRDLKPANLFLSSRDDGSPRIKLLDFGIAKLVAEGVTCAGATRSLGTPLYMAPEQFQIDHRVTPATDIFALGMMVFTLLVGKPFWAEEAEAGANVFAFAAMAAGGPKDPASIRARRRGVHLPEALDAWFAKATALSPTTRFTSASEAIEVLAEALAPRSLGQPTSTAAPIKQSKRWTSTLPMNRSEVPRDPKGSYDASVLHRTPQAVSSAGALSSSGDIPCIPPVAQPLMPADALPAAPSMEPLLGSRTDTVVVRSISRLPGKRERVLMASAVAMSSAAVVVVMSILAFSLIHTGSAVNSARAASCRSAARETLSVGIHAIPSRVEEPPVAPESNAALPVEDPAAAPTPMPPPSPPLPAFAAPAPVVQEPAGSPVRAEAQGDQATGKQRVEPPHPARQPSAVAAQAGQSSVPARLTKSARAAVVYSQE